MCAAEILWCVENNAVFAFLFDEWMHALMTGEGGASSGSWARIICKWVQQGGHQRWTICLSTTHHSPCQPCSKSDNLGVMAALFNNGMIANYNPLCINRQTGAIREEEEGVVYKPLSLRKRMRTIFHKLWRAEQTIWAGKVRVGLEWLVWEVHLFALSVCHLLFHHPVLPGGTKAAQVHHQPEMRLCEYRGQQRLGDLPLQLQNVEAEMANESKEWRCCIWWILSWAQDYPGSARVCWGMTKPLVCGVTAWYPVQPCTLYSATLVCPQWPVWGGGGGGSQLPFLQRSLRMRGCTWQQTRKREQMNHRHQQGMEPSCWLGLGKI